MKPVGNVTQLNLKRLLPFVAVIEILLLNYFIIYFIINYIYIINYFITIIIIITSSVR